MRRKHILAGIMAAALAIGMLGGCGSSSSDAKNTESSTAAAEKDTATSGTKKLVIGDTTFNPENAEADVNPHNDYSAGPASVTGLAKRWYIIQMPWRSSRGWRSPGKMWMS